MVKATSTPSHHKDCLDSGFEAEDTGQTVGTRFASGGRGRGGQFSLDQGLETSPLFFLAKQLSLVSLWEEIAAQFSFASE